MEILRIIDGRRLACPASLALEERILLIRLSHLGDVVHALVVFHALRAAHPRARLAWAIEPEFAGLIEGLSGLERTILFERRRGAAAWLQLAAQLASFNPTWIVDAQGNLKSAAVSLCAPSARRSGLHRRDWREPAGSRVLHDWAEPTSAAPAHAIDRMLQLCLHVGGHGAAPNFDLCLSSDELARGEGALRTALGSAPAPEDVLLGLSSAGDVRSWPLGRWIDLARELARAGRRVLAISGPGEIEIGRQFAAHFESELAVRSWIGQRGLRELAAALTIAARAGARYVGVDSGPLHLAVAAGLSVIALEGPQSHLRTGPWPPPERESEAPRHRVVHSAQPPSCAPCFSRVCRHAQGPICMGALDAARVVAALNEEWTAKACPAWQPRRVSPWA